MEKITIFLYVFKAASKNMKKRRLENENRPLCKSRGFKNT
jgi:hypothetical protein